MDLSHLGEEHPVYRELDAENGIRHYSFLQSMIRVAIDTTADTTATSFSHPLIKAINYHAIVGLHAEAGEYRARAVAVGAYQPPPYDRVHPLMDDFVRQVGEDWGKAPTTLAAYALWRINHIHPFVNGNGRTARAVCYFIICVKVGALLPGRTILPELLKQNPHRQDYITALKEADGNNLSPLTYLLDELLTMQLTTD